MKMRVFNTRQEMISALIPKNSVLCEIGVFEGEFLNDLRKLCMPKELIGVDIFEGTIVSGNQDGNFIKSVNLDESYKTLNKMYCNTEVQIVKSPSYDYLSSIEDNTLDSIYIDGDHSYGGCFQDLCIAHKKVKNGGYIMGHDYEINLQKAHHNHIFGVNSAVNRYCSEYGQNIYAKAMDGCVSYAIVLTK